MKIRTTFYHKADARPLYPDRDLVADISIEAASENDIAKAAKKAFAEFASKHSEFRLVDGDVFVKFESVK